MKFCVLLLLASLPAAAVELVAVPEGGLQPQVAVHDGEIHLIYFRGEAKAGDLFYVHGRDGKYSEPLRVNSEPGASIAMGTIRGGQIAVGHDGVVHVAWNGSATSKGHPMIYARLLPGAQAFEPLRNLMRQTTGLDGGGTLAVSHGKVYVAWHGCGAGAVEGEAGRPVWIAKSSDNGKTFAAEASAWDEPAGACGCCGMSLFADHAGTLFGLYRSATGNVHRDIYLVSSKDGKRFEGSMVQPWEINAYPMSSMSFAEGGGATVGAWETGGQVFWGEVRGSKVAKAMAAPGEGKGRKHPRVARNAAGETLLVWTEGTGWQRGGSLAWQLYDKDGKPKGEAGAAPGVPAWSFAAPVARAKGEFTIFR